MHVIGILMGIALNMEIAFDNIAIFTLLIMPIHELGYLSIFYSLP
jgi:hypothetical protein